MVEILRNFAFGAIMALGELVPGIGMQTVAIIIGIYDEIISFFYQGTEFLKTLVLFFLARRNKMDLAVSFRNISFKFGIPVFMTIVVVILLLAKTVTHLFDTYPVEVSSAAFGIVLASIFIPFNEMKEKTWIHFVIICLSFAMLFGLFGNSMVEDQSASPSVLAFFGGGLLSSLAGFFPGISITFALLVMGLYEPLLRNIDTFTSGPVTVYSFSSVAVFLVGLGIGLLVCVRILAILIERFKSYFLALIVGLILASLRATWPFVLNGAPVAPWTIPIPDFTRQLIIITIAVVFVTVLRKLAEGKSTISSSFGEAKRTIITS